MSIALILVSGVLVAVIVAPIVKVLVHVLNLTRSNFCGRTTPLYGTAVVLAGLLLYSTIFWACPSAQVGTFLLAVFIFGTAGLVDDLFGSRDVGGFMGHFGLLLRGKFTTGVLKAFLGGMGALVICFIVGKGSITGSITSSALIALMANALNLLDLRPGRAVSCFWFGVLLLFAGTLGHLSVWREILSIMPVVIWLTTLDRSGKVMLGDAGSNTLGAILGLAIAWEVSLLWQLLIVLCLLILHVYAEKYSITRLIERNRILNAIDSRLGVR